MGYDFKTLSPYEFEVLVQDLLQKELQLTLESFKSGQDQGIDLRYSRDNSNNIIIQCKHFAGSTFAKLKSALKDELIKIQALNPLKYKFVTSLKLSPKQKDKLLELCPENIINLEDIYGCEDLNNFLRKFPEVEKDHFKLWLSSSNVLECLLRSDVYNKSAYTIEKIKQKIRLFVPNDSLFESLSTLKKHNYVVVSGAPGVGKTTLAEMLILPYIEKGYELIEISEDIKSAWACYNDTKKQVFYFDDFLGQTTLQKSLNKNEDGRLIDFIDKIFNAKNKKFILTTREYILNEAKLNYEKLANFEFEQCIIDLKTYTDKIKAHILYNHLHFSGLDIKYFESILEDNRYFNIIKHKNYNPRIIEYMTKPSKILPEKYYELFIENLNNPFKIWEIAFNKHLNDISKSILLSILTFNWNTYNGDIEKFASVIYKKIFNGASINKIQYRHGLKVLNGDLIIIDRYLTKFANPSIQDFLEYYIRENDLLTEFLSIINKIVQLRWFYNRYINKFNSPNSRMGGIFLEKLINKDFYQELTMQDLLGNLCLILDVVYTLQDTNKIIKIKDYLAYVLDKAKKSNFSAYEYEQVFEKCDYMFYEDSEIINSFLTSLKEIFKDNIEDLQTFEDYLVLNSFISNFDYIFQDDEISNFQSDFGNKSEDIIEELIKDCSSSSQIEELIGKLEEIEGIFEYDKLEKVYEHLDYLREKEMSYADDFDPNDWEDHSSPKEMPINFDAEIISMFDGLSQ